MDFILTTGNVDDRKPLKNMDLHKWIFGKLFGDKGYIGIPAQMSLIRKD